MKATNTDKMYQKKVAVSYDSIEDLMNRQEAMQKTLEGYLKRNGDEQYISDITIYMSEEKYTLTFTLDLKA